MAKRTHEYSQIKVYPEMTPSGVYSDPRKVLIKKKQETDQGSDLIRFLLNVDLNLSEYMYYLLL